jgi:hypothetical protein
MNGVCKEINTLFKEYMTRTHLSEIGEPFFQEKKSVKK